MGGYGSTRWGGHIKKTTVEECLTLSAGVLSDSDGFRERIPWRGSIRWTNAATGEETATTGFVFEPHRGIYDGRVRLQYTLTRRRYGQEDEVRELDYPVEMETTPCNFGGERWWFRCPLKARDGGACDRRCFKLYNPPGQDYFGCRECYDLTYRSAQEAHQFDSLYRSIAGKMGVPMEAVKDALKCGPPKL